MDIRIEVERLRQFTAAAFVAAGCSEEEASAVADGLVDANLAGHDSHGVVRVPRYLGWLASGEVEAGRTISVVAETEAMATLDGHYGFGATVGRQAVAFGIAKAERAGAAVIALRHAGHLGRIGQWAEMALEAGLVSLHFVNVAGSMLVAPFGGVDRRFSTAPIAMGFPAPGGEAPVVLDFATSAVAEGKVLVASKGGKPIPDGSLIGPDGRLSADPATLYGPLGEGAYRDHAQGQGAIRTMGEHKGSGLALLCELLGGALAGSGAAGPSRQRFANGMVSIYMAPSAFGSEEAIARETRSFVEFVRSSRPAEPGGAVLLPGEPERRTRAERLAGGVPLTEETLASLLEAARAAGLPPDDPRMLRTGAS